MNSDGILVLPVEENPGDARPLTELVRDTGDSEKALLQISGPNGLAGKQTSLKLPNWALQRDHQELLTLRHSTTSDPANRLRSELHELARRHWIR